MNPGRQSEETKVRDAAALNCNIIKTPPSGVYVQGIKRIPRITRILSFKIAIS